MESKIVISDSKYIWLLDAGHGSDTPGKRSPKWEDCSQLFEWEYARKIREKLIEMLDAYKISYAIINPEDYDISLSERCKRINEIHSKYSNSYGISLHGNAAGIESASGYEVWTSPGETHSDKIAEVFYQHAAQTKLFKMRKDTSDGDNDKESRFYILVHTTCPMILTENGFYTNERECKQMLTDKFITMVAVMHLTAILEIEHDEI